MEMHCLAVETPTTASSCSTDPLYDNCPPFAQRMRDRDKEMESRVLCPAVTRLPGPRSPPPGLAPVVAPTLVRGGRGPGAWPDHSYCSWRGGPEGRAWGAEPGPGMSMTGGEQGSGWGAERRGEDRARLSQSRSPSQSEAHRSALSLYDNLPDADTPDSLQDACHMETSFQEQTYQAWAPEQQQLRGLMEGEGASEEKSPWSSCEIILAESDSINQDQNQDQAKEPEPDSGSCGFQQGDPMSHLQLPSVVSPPQPQHATGSLQHCQTGCQAPWPQAAAQHQEPSSWAPRTPPPVPLADPSASALRSLLTSLQQQIVRQQEQYDARIISLEQRNEELQVEVVRLKTNLAQQQQWYRAVQAKIAASERARIDAEQRNSALQKDMEQFFDTFGELNNEAKKTEYIVKSF